MEKSPTTPTYFYFIFFVEPPTYFRFFHLAFHQDLKWNSPNQNNPLHPVSYHFNKFANTDSVENEVNKK